MNLTLEPEAVKLADTRAVRVGVSVINKGENAVQLDFPTTQRIEILLKNGRWKSSFEMVGRSKSGKGAGIPRDQPGGTAGIHGQYLHPGNEGRQHLHYRGVLPRFRTTADQPASLTVQLNCGERPSGTVSIAHFDHHPFCSPSPYCAGRGVGSAGVGGLTCGGGASCRASRASNQTTKIHRTINPRMIAAAFTPSPRFS